MENLSHFQIALIGVSLLFVCLPVGLSILKNKILKKEAK